MVPLIIVVLIAWIAGIVFVISFVTPMNDFKGVFTFKLFFKSFMVSVIGGFVGFIISSIVASLFIKSFYENLSEWVSSILGFIFISAAIPSGIIANRHIKKKWEGIKKFRPKSE